MGEGLRGGVLFIFSYGLATAFKLTQGANLKKAFLLTVYVIIKHEIHAFLSGEKGRKDISVSEKEQANGRTLMNVNGKINSPGI